MEFYNFFNDKNWDGGDLILHSTENIVIHKRTFFFKKIPISKIIEAKKNIGAFGLSTPNSYHSVSRQEKSLENRLFVYGSLSIPESKVFTRRIDKNINVIDFITDVIDETRTTFVRVFDSIKRRF